MADNGSSRKATCCSKNSSSTERLGVEFVLPITSVAKMEACPSETTSTSRAVTSIGDVQSFSRMPSQRRRRLWTLAARAAARRENFSHEKEPLSACSGVLKNHAETSTQSSSFLKPGTVRTQDSGISSMDYVTSRDANSPNSEEAGFRQRASLSLTASEHSQAVSTQPHSQTPRPQTDAARLHCPTLSTAVRTKIVVSGECEGDDTHPGSTLRYANHCTSYVPDWARRNWSSAPRPLISRQRSSLEVGYDPAPDWAASMETLNMQSSLYQQNRRLFYGRYGRASCPKTPTYYDHPNPPVTTIHMEEEEGEGETEPSMDNPSVTGDVDHLRRRRFDTLPQPCWCERPPPPHTHTCSFRPPPLACRTGSSMLSPFFHCSACPYRTLEPAYFMPPYQCDLPQRHIRRRMLKRMSSEPTPPTWMSEEGSTPPKRRAPPPQPPEFASPPPLPRRAAKSEASQYGYTEQRIISSTPKTDILILEPDSCGSAAWGRRPPMLQEGLRRGCSVDEAYYSPRWGRQSSFVSDPLAEGYRPTRRPMTASYPMTHVYDQGDPRDWYTCSRRRGNDSAPSRLGVMPHFYNPNFPGSSSVLRESMVFS
ncbi:unnamed protein product [Mesocestoides corti]|uniref:Protein kinase domain-containing protein n=1 Tax=Mesocestoides corti TaxID=53468 RepID=A0A0R3U3L9_MESCO|nr:unnamed protein product [Mesocestoides corti]